MRYFTVLTVLVGLFASPVSAQTVADDARCLLVSNGFSKQSKDARQQRLAAMSAAFYLGRLDGRLTPFALVEMLRSQSNRLPAAQANTIMNSCAARAEAANNRLRTAAQQSGAK